MSNKVYPQNVSGKFRRLKWIINSALLSVFAIIPLIRYDRGEYASNQAVLIDITGRKLYFFGIEIWPQEVYYLMFILILSAIALFFITSILGRVWCGYTCFQTVFTDIFIAIERFFQGDRNQRILLDRRPFSIENISKKVATHISWIIVSLITGFVFTWYFNDALYTIKNSLHPTQSIIFWSAGVGAATYIMAGFARDKVCTFMCPYSRFQSVMFDPDTLLIAYDKNRGEKRGKHKQGESFEGRGHCIDCKQCVVVCPQNIDIRNGLQMECIACGLCIDACDSIMEKVNLPKGLIRYATENAINSNTPSKIRFFKARTIYYIALLTICSSLVLSSIILKADFDVSIVSNRSPAFVILSDGSIRNGYTMQLVNKSSDEMHFSILADKLKMFSSEVSDLSSITLAPGEVRSIGIYIIMDGNNPHTQELDLTIIRKDNKNEEKQRVIKAKFLTPKSDT